MIWAGAGVCSHSSAGAWLLGGNLALLEPPAIAPGDALNWPEPGFQAQAHRRTAQGHCQVINAIFGAGF